MKWRCTYFCRKCDKELNHREVYGGSGICPYCGNKNKDWWWADYVKKSKRWVVDVKQPWWKFWRKNIGHWEYMEYKDEM